MCISKLGEKITLKSDLHVYKAFRWAEGTPGFHKTFTSGGIYKFVKGLNIDKSTYKIIIDLYIDSYHCTVKDTSYLSGFHCFDKKADALTFAKHFNSINATILRCTIPKGTTIQIGYECSSMKVYITPKLIVPEMAWEE